MQLDVSYEQSDSSRRRTDLVRVFTVDNFVLKIVKFTIDARFEYKVYQALQLSEEEAIRHFIVPLELLEATGESRKVGVVMPAYFSSLKCCSN